MKKIISFFKESYAELKKVIWPTYNEVVASTQVVIVSVAIIAAVLGLIDMLLWRGLEIIF